MNVQLEYNNQRVTAFSELVGKYPDSEFASPKRSTVPLLAYWRSPEAPLRQFGALIGESTEADATLSFEHKVPVRAGRGKASHTDLMISGPGYAIAVEAKYTEPPYDTVSQWLLREVPRDRGGNANSPSNRSQVLRGWLAVINESAGASLLTAEIVKDCTYQLIHRTASVCAAPVRNRAVVYHCFQHDSGQATYIAQMQRLAGLLNFPPALRFFVVGTELHESDTYRDLVQRWNSDRSDVSNDVRAGLLNGTLLDFGENHVTATK